jgi:MarR family transcriptional regulator, transcriptional regulator for hemolysin
MTPESNMREPSGSSSVPRQKLGSDNTRSVTGSAVVDLRRRLDYALRDATHCYTKLFERRARALGLTLLQCRALVFLAENHGMTQARLAKQIGVTPMALVRIVDRMETQGWVRRIKTPVDRRIRRLAATSAASTLLEQIQTILEDTPKQALSGFSDEECEQFKCFLDRLHANLSRSLDLSKK